MSGFYGSLFGTTQVQVQTKEIEIEKTSDNIIDMDRVVDFQISENGLQLYFKDGSGYWLEK